VACRAANARYSSEHRTPTATIPALAARTHLEQLAALGIGIEQVSRLTGLAARWLREIRHGRIETLKATTAARILATTPTPADGALVRATRSWRFVDSLQREGYTRQIIAWHLGHTSQQLQYARRTIRQSSARSLASVYQRLANR
jgi:hypothetical protein